MGFLAQIGLKGNSPGLVMNVKVEVVVVGWCGVGVGLVVWGWEKGGKGKFPFAKNAPELS